MARLEGTVLAPIEGYFVDRLGPKKMTLVGVVLCCVGFMLLSRVNSLTMFYVVFVLLVSTGSALATYIGPATAVANWFIKKRGRALGMQMSGYGLGGVLVPAIAWIIAQYGWRTAFEFSGILMFVVGIPVAFVVRHRPEQYGYLPDGEVRKEPVTEQPVSVAKAAPAEVDFTARQALKSKAFWLMAAAFTFAYMTTDTVVIHLPPHLQDKGFSPQVAATAVGSFALISIIGRLGFGWLGDVMDKRYAVSISLAMQCIGLLILANMTSPWHVVLYLAIFAPGYGGRTPLLGAIRGEYFGRKAFGTIAGLTQVVTMLGTVAGPVLAGWVYDTTGSYYLIFNLLAVASLIGIALVLMLKRPVLASGSSHQSGLTSGTT